MPTNTPQVRVLVYREGNELVAQGLEVDVRVTATDLDLLRDRFSYHLGIVQHVAERTGASMWHYGVAAAHHFEEWERRTCEWARHSYVYYLA